MGGLALTENAMSYTIVPFEPVLIDTNIILYSFDPLEGKKHEEAKRFLAWRITQWYPIVFSTQNLNEAFAATIANKKNLEEARLILSHLQRLPNVRIISPTVSQIFAASKLSQNIRMSYWDALLAETMFENNVFTICTEDEAFRNDRRLNVINIFKKSRKQK